MERGKGHGSVSDLVKIFETDSTKSPSPDNVSVNRQECQQLQAINQVKEELERFQNSPQKDIYAYSYFFRKLPQLIRTIRGIEDYGHAAIKSEKEQIESLLPKCYRQIREKLTKENYQFEEDDYVKMLIQEIDLRNVATPPMLPSVLNDGNRRKVVQRKYENNSTANSILHSSSTHFPKLAGASTSADQKVQLPPIIRSPYVRNRDINPPNKYKPDYPGRKLDDQNVKKESNSPVTLRRSMTFHVSDQSDFRLNNSERSNYRKSWNSDVKIQEDTGLKKDGPSYSRSTSKLASFMLGDKSDSSNYRNTSSSDLSLPSSDVESPRSSGKKYSGFVGTFNTTLKKDGLTYPFNAAKRTYSSLRDKSKRPAYPNLSDVRNQKEIVSDPQHFPAKYSGITETFNRASKKDQLTYPVSASKLPSSNLEDKSDVMFNNLKLPSYPNSSTTDSDGVDVRNQEEISSDPQNYGMRYLGITETCNPALKYDEPIYSVNATKLPSSNFNNPQGWSLADYRRNQEKVDKAPANFQMKYSGITDIPNTAHKKKDEPMYPVISSKFGSSNSKDNLERPGYRNSWTANLDVLEVKNQEERNVKSSPYFGTKYSGNSEISKKKYEPTYPKFGSSNSKDKLDNLERPSYRNSWTANFDVLKVENQEDRNIKSSPYSGTKYSGNSEISKKKYEPTYAVISSKFESSNSKDKLDNLERPGYRNSWSANLDVLEVKNQQERNVKSSPYSGAKYSGTSELSNTAYKKKDEPTKFGSSNSNNKLDNLERPGYRNSWTTNSSPYFGTKYSGITETPNMTLKRDGLTYPLITPKFGSDSIDKSDSSANNPEHSGYRKSWSTNVDISRVNNQETVITNPQQFRGIPNTALKTEGPTYPPTFSKFVPANPERSGYRKSWNANVDGSEVKDQDPQHFRTKYSGITETPNIALNTEGPTYPPTISKSVSANLRNKSNIPVDNAEGSGYRKSWNANVDGSEVKDQDPQHFRTKYSGITETSNIALNTEGPTYPPTTSKSVSANLRNKSNIPVDNPEGSGYRKSWNANVDVSEVKDQDPQHFRTKYSGITATSNIALNTEGPTYPPTISKSVSANLRNKPNIPVDNPEGSGYRKSWNANVDVSEVKDQNPQHFRTKYSGITETSNIALNTEGPTYPPTISKSVSANLRNKSNIPVDNPEGSGYRKSWNANVDGSEVKDQDPQHFRTKYSGITATSNIALNTEGPTYPPTISKSVSANLRNKSNIPVDNPEGSGYRKSRNANVDVSEVKDQDSQYFRTKYSGITDMPNMTLNRDGLTYPLIAGKFKSTNSIDKSDTPVNNPERSGYRKSWNANFSEVKNQEIPNTPLNTERPTYAPTISKSTSFNLRNKPDITINNSKRSSYRNASSIDKDQGKVIKDPPTFPAKYSEITETPTTTLKRDGPTYPVTISRFASFNSRGKSNDPVDSPERPGYRKSWSTDRDSKEVKNQEKVVRGPSSFRNKFRQIGEMLDTVLKKRLL